MVPSEFQIGLSSILIAWVALLENREERPQKADFFIWKENIAPQIQGLQAISGWAQYDAGTLHRGLSNVPQVSSDHHGPLLNTSTRDCSKGLVITRGGTAEDKQASG